MKNKDNTSEIGKLKKIIIYSLYTVAIAIMCMGSYFSVYSLRNNIHFQVISTSIPGFILGILVIYLGLRYYFQVSEFKDNFLKSKEAFLWSNFFKKNESDDKTKRFHVMKGR